MANNSTNGTKYSGIPFQFDGQTYIIPPLSPRQMREFQPIMQQAAKSVGVDSLGDLIIQRFAPVIHAAMTRNYPELTLEQVTDFLDLDTYGLAYAAALGRRAYEAARFRETKELDDARNGTAPKPGELKPETMIAAEAPTLVGATSTGE